jgi:hypothetical protein
VSPNDGELKYTAKQMNAVAFPECGSQQEIKRQDMAGRSGSVCILI